MSCTGQEGPTGPAGEQGEPGPGSRIVYQSTMPILTWDAFTVYVPEIKIDDMPAVSVYVRMEGFSVWIELPFYFEGYPDWGMMYLLDEGKVIFDQCKYYYYKIVVIT
jgi:hypothetical protein